MADQDASSEDKQLPATARRLQQAAEDGQVPRSRDAAHALVLGTAMAAFGLLGGSMSEAMLRLVRDGLSFSASQLLDGSNMAWRLRELGTQGFSGVAPILIALVLAGVLASMIPGGLNFTLKPLALKPGRLNPLQGLGRLFSKDGAINLVKLLVITAALVLSAWLYTGGSLRRFAGLADLPLLGALHTGFDTLTTGLGILTGVLCAVALVDVPLQWFRHRQRLKMSHQEVKEEGKQTEGNPRNKSRIRQRQRQISRGRMLAAVPSADAVITNPTHFAVAIRYDEFRMGAPRVVAKGADQLAARIRELAGDCGIPIVELPPLARALYKHVEIDREVPAALYAAVAQVLAYVFHLRHHVPGRGRAPAAPTDVEVPPELDPLQADPQSMQPGGEMDDDLSEATA